MANEVVPGTIECEPDTIAGEAFAELSATIDPEQLTAAVETILKKIAFGPGAGLVKHIVAEITDGKYLRVLDGKIVGADAGGGAPAAHGESHENGGGDQINVAGLSGELADPQPPKTHGAEHASDGGDPIPAATTTTRGTVELATDGESAAGLAVQANDGRLSDPRPPSAHASTHAAGQSDPIKLDDLAAADDNTDLNASTTAHGLFPKLDASSGKFLAGGSAGWVALAGPDPYAQNVIDLSQAITSGVAFTVFETSVLPEGFSGAIVYEYLVWGGSAASPFRGHTVGGRANLGRATAGSLSISDGGQGAALGEGSTYTHAIAANANAVRVQLTIGATTTIYVAGWWRIYGGVMP